MFKSAITWVFLLMIFSSFREGGPRMRTGFYFSNHGHASTLFKIDDDKIAWYSDNALKEWGRGEYALNEGDSTMEITYHEIWRSKYLVQNVPEFTSTLEVKWNATEGRFELKDYAYREKSKSIKDLINRVESSCGFKAKKDDGN